MWRNLLNNKQRTRLRGAIKRISQAQTIRISAPEKEGLLRSAAAIVKKIHDEERPKWGNLPEQFRETWAGQEIQLAMDQLDEASDHLAAGRYHEARAAITNAIAVTPRISYGTWGAGCVGQMSLDELRATLTALPAGKCAEIRS